MWYKEEDTEASKPAFLYTDTIRYDLKFQDDCENDITVTEDKDRAEDMLGKFFSSVFIALMIEL